MYVNCTFFFFFIFNTLTADIFLFYFLFIFSVEIFSILGSGHLSDIPSNRIQRKTFLLPDILKEVVHILGFDEENIPFDNFFTLSLMILGWIHSVFSRSANLFRL